MAVNRYLPGQLSIIGAVIASFALWLLAAAGLVGVISFMPEMGWPQAAFLIALCGAPQAAILTARYVRLLRHVRSTIPVPVLERRLHGSLDMISDLEGRPLRPIGRPVRDIASRTGLLLAQLINMPSVRVFHGVRVPGSKPLVAHAVAAGRTVILVESVAWPSGQYQTDGSGRISCDGLYIGQSVSTLMAAVRQCRNLLPRNHRVCAMVVVHPTGEAAPSLPVSTMPDLTWVDVDGALGELRRRLPRKKNLSTHAMAALVAATASE